MGTIVVILLVVLGIALIIAVIKAVLWLAGLVILAIIGLVAWRWLSSRFRSATSPTT